MRRQLSPSQITVRATWQRVEHLGKQRWHVCRDVTAAARRAYTTVEFVAACLTSDGPIPLRVLAS